jgi:hypothetical protein
MIVSPIQKSFDVKEILSDKEQNALARLADDEVTLGAIKKVLLFGIYYNGTAKGAKQGINPLMNFAMQIDVNNVMTNEQLGLVVRAKTEALVTVEVGIRELEQFKVVTDSKEIKKNPAR